MSRKLPVLAVLLLLAPAALAATAAAPPPPDAAPAAAPTPASVPAFEEGVAPAAPEAPAEGDELERLFEDLAPGLDGEMAPEARYACPDGSSGNCTSSINCRVFGIPATCAGERVCNNPQGGVCNGWCYCH